LKSPFGQHYYGSAKTKFNMKNIRPHKIILRFLIIFFIHLIFVYGDTSMEIWEFNVRKNIFSLVFISYWMLVWFIAESFTNVIYKKQSLSNNKSNTYTYILFFTNLIFAFWAAFAFNLLYRSMDIHVFHRGEGWSIIPILNPELTLSLFSFHMLFFTFDTFFASILKSKEAQLNMEKMKRENMKAQYLVLKSQLDPHFLFNSLSVLSSIIHTDVDLGEEFIMRLSKTLRYVIEKKELSLVPVKEEIHFVDDYFFLINQRFEEGIIFENAIDESIVQENYIPPASLQLLIENTVKHNRFSKEKPLNIKIYNDHKNIIVVNNINTREDQSNSTNQGLHNLSQRYSYFSEAEVIISIKDKEFMVSMPLLTKADYEHFNF